MLRRLKFHSENCQIQKTNQEEFFPSLYFHDVPINNNPWARTKYLLRRIKFS